MLSTKSFFKVAAGKVHIFWGRKHFVAIFSYKLGTGGYNHGHMVAGGRA
jgi:hypothetical protein